MAYYGAPSYARKTQIWPPLAKAPKLADIDGIAEKHATRRAVTVIGEKEEVRAFPPESAIDHLGELARDTKTLYHPLHDGETIRILEIQPGHKKDPVQCGFHYANLKYRHIDYKALSYVWGKSKGTHYDAETKRWVDDVFNIRCNDHIIDITPNLFRAITHIRSSTQPTFLWADAVCINQDDSRERGHQVTLMDIVYGRASSVAIWVGQKGSFDGHFWDDSAGQMVEYPEEIEDIKAQRAFGAVCEVVNHWPTTTGKSKHASYQVFPSHSSSPGSGLEFDAFEELPYTARVSSDT